MMDYLFNAEYPNEGSLENSLGINVETTRPLAVDIQLKIYEVVVPILGIVIIIVNLAIVVSSGFILHKGQQPRSTYLFLGNVALSDFLIGANVLFSQFFPKSSRNETSCSIQVGFIVASALTSVYSIGLIGVDRYLYILYGLQYQRYIYPTRARLMILGCWLLGLIIGFLPTMGWRGDTNNGRMCWYIILTPQPLVLITAVIGVLPLIVIIVLYSIILRHALQKVSELKAAGDNNRGSTKGNLRLFRGRAPPQPPPPTSSNTLGVLPSIEETSNEHSEVSADERVQKRKGIFKFFMRKPTKEPRVAPVYNPSKWKAIKVVLFTTGAYFLTWGPFFVASALFSVCNVDLTPILCDKLRVAIASPLIILGLSNSLLNPLIYAWWHNGFRQSAKKLYYSVVKCRRNSDQIQPGIIGHRADNHSSGSPPQTVVSETDTSDAEQPVSARNLLVKNRRIPIENGDSEYKDTGETNA